MQVYQIRLIMRTVMSFALILCTLSSSGQISFEKYFTDKVLRFDFMMARNSQKTFSTSWLLR
jgi:hypothetical protein